MVDLPYDLPTPQQLLQYAPLVHFDENETQFPISLSLLLEYSTLRDHDKPAWSIPAPSKDDLATYNASNYYLDIGAAAYPGILPAGGAISRTPMIVTVQFYDDLFVDINYIFLYGFQGPQTLLISPVIIDSFTCVAPSLGEHQGDIERIAVRLLPTMQGKQDVVGVAFEAHGHTTLYPWDQLSWSGLTNPVVYAALNGHSSHTLNEHFAGWVSESDYLVVDVGSYLRGAGAIWEVQNPADMVLVGLYQGNPINDESWVAFSGALGAPKQNRYTTATHFDGRPLDLDQLASCTVLAGGAQVLNLLSKDLLTGDPPKGLGARKYAQLAPTVTYRQILSESSPNGTTYALSTNPDDVDGGLVIKTWDPTDKCQLWYIDKWGPDEFVLWNRGTGKIACATAKNTQIAQVRIPTPGGSIVWSLGDDHGTGFTTISFGRAGVLDIHGGKAYDGCPVYAWSDKGQSTQRWGFGAAQAVYEQLLVRQDPRLALSVDPNNSTRAILMNADPTDPQQLWLHTIVPGSTTFTLQNQQAKTYLRANGAGKPVSLVDSPDAQCNWGLSSQGGDNFAVRPTYDTTQNLDVTGGKSHVSEDTPVETYGWNSGQWQQWQLVPIEFAS